MERLHHEISAIKEDQSTNMNDELTQLLLGQAQLRLPNLIEINEHLGEKKE